MNKSGPGAGPPQIREDDETCPVCKTTRYFNKDMEFLINPECYHRMCKTCVDRIFKDGPNQCPYAGCVKTLRPRGFKKAYFADLSIEREVDIRRRVAAIFNKVEEDFETLKDYNEYLEMVEDLTEKLVSGNPTARSNAEAELKAWEVQHKAEIERNRRLARESEDDRRKRVAAEQQAAKQRRMLEMQEEADEKVKAARFREEMLNSLQTAEAGHGAEVFNKVMLKKRGQQRRDAAMEAAAAAAALGGSGLSIRGLRDKKTEKAAIAAEDGPYDPYGGLDMAPSRIDVSTDRLGEYRSEWLDVIRTKDDYKVGGYSSEEYVARALFEAFSGLGVFIEDDKVDKAVSTAGAAVAAATGTVSGRMDVDDPF